MARAIFLAGAMHTCRARYPLPYTSPSCTDTFATPARFLWVGRVWHQGWDDGGRGQKGRGILRAAVERKEEDVDKIIPIHLGFSNSASTLLMVASSSLVELIITIIKNVLSRLANQSTFQPRALISSCKEKKCYLPIRWVGTLHR